MKYKIVGIIFNFTSYIPLALPMYKATIGKEESFESIIRGFDLCEFSPWGSLLVTMPIILLAISFLKIRNSIKNLLLILFYMINTIIVHLATFAAGNWIRETADGFVNFKPYILFYLLSMFLGLICLYVHNNKYYDYSEF